ncbi:uncharacterized protein LOC126832844 [Adelges cooleyi]|uniref:uncharacterized protein LOC126832844 n=1 Tax=Adelges cooleyi TaxID=133065 RepID=UPI00218032BC|nr:uncharacterized protein LOC126832844 [Adelges cooleyi]
MNFYYILIAFAFAKVVHAFNVLAVFKEDYKKQVVFTNNQIRLAFHEKKLHNAIKYILCATDQRTYRYSMVDIAFMMAILPESIDNFTIPELQQHIKYQTDMQTEIFRGTNLAVPPVRPNYNFDDNLYPELKRDRRFLIKEATVYLILNNKTLPGPDFSETRIGDLCRLVGLFKSITNPDSYTVSAEVGDLNTCTITDADNNVSKYRPIKGRVYRVDTDPHILLRSQALSVQYV